MCRTAIVCKTATVCKRAIVHKMHPTAKSEGVPEGGQLDFCFDLIVASKKDCTVNEKVACVLVRASYFLICDVI